MLNVEARALNYSRPITPLGNLPARMNVLFITTAARTGGWLSEALALDRASVVQLQEAIGGNNGLTLLRDQVFDVILVSHEPNELDALELVDAIRGGGSEEPIVVLGEQESDELTALVYEVGGDAYLCVTAVTTRTMLVTLSRAIERYALVRENRRLVQADKYRLQQEQQDAQRLLAEQRALIDSPRDVPTELKEHYRELLRMHVIMGSGNLGEEIKRLAHLMAGGRLTTSDALQLHLDVLEELIRGLGNRSARHVITRADLLALDLLHHLAESYRQA